jgi:hypothetical protein
MEASIVDRPEAKARSATAAKIFKYSDFVDVGEGAAECEQARGGCENPEHFHAWVRLPNPYQRTDIREKALAAKARRLRELRDPDSNASVVLDDALAGLTDPAFTDTLIDELIASEWPQDYLTATGDVERREEFEHVAQDREEYNRLRADEEALDPEQRSEEYTQIAAQMERYVAAINERLREIQEPKRRELRERSLEALIGLVRARRVEDEADDAFMDTYNSWLWFVGTFKPDLHPTLRRPHIPMWEEIGRRDRPAPGTMFGEAPEVIEALRAAFTKLQGAFQQGASGN